MDGKIVERNENIELDRIEARTISLSKIWITAKIWEAWEMFHQNMTNQMNTPDFS